jgi:hypothetical protein
VYTDAKSRTFLMEPSSEAKGPSPTAVSVETQTLDRITTALEKCNQLMERHLAASEITVPARALYFILRDAGFGRTPTQTQEQKQTPQQQEVTNQLHHQYGMRR